ncbi:PREDICTED: mas-related G-protein coupled receptor member X2-like [Hipposideros armiger]|uniref:Mas-related G-protein coupled receptor member X2-like n=1 Tax=Hipposideros armiger TaxID=186990 RepID=A0A8B7S2Q6_HIPAR|nr:PREDICTED: mas-related G-protein coupled receptor member X2-like [Hipposideros armiger]
MALSGTSGAFLGVNATVTYLGTSPTPMNGSDQATPENITMGTLISLLLIVIICLVGLAGNAVVLWLLGFRMRRNTFSVYILNLAGADFLLLCCQIIRSLQTLIYYFHSIPRFFITVFTVAYFSGLSLLSAVSTERCLSVLWPIWYHCHRPTHMSAVLCALLGALSLLLSILKGNYCGLLFSSLYQVWCQGFDFITVGWLIFLSVLLSGSIPVLITRLLCGSQWVQLTRLYVTVLLTVLVCLLCGLPWGCIHWFLIYWIKSGLVAFLFPLYLVALVLSCINSCANPIIYFFIGSFRQQWRKRRQTLKLVLQRALRDFPEGDEHGGSLPQETLEMSGSSLAP